MANGKNNRRKVAETLVIIIIVLVGSFFGLYPDNGIDVNVDTEANGELILTMLDVGQADSFLLVQDGEIALVDCGTKSRGDDVVKFLKENEIDKIDYLFATHPHEDHLGGMLEVITNIEVGTIVIPEFEKGKVVSSWYKTLMQELGNEKYNIKHPEVGDIYKLGDAKIKVVGPMTKYPKEVNNYSTVLKVSFGEMDVLMTGDAEDDAEKEILQSGEAIDAEILKVGHHGSDTSSCEEFLDAVNPEYALISAGFGNRFDHPIKSTMDNLKKRNILVYRTDESGSVTVRITSKEAIFDKEYGDYLSGEELEKSR